MFLSGADHKSRWTALCKSQWEVRMVKSSPGEYHLSTMVLSGVATDVNWHADRCYLEWQLMSIDTLILSTWGGWLPTCPINSYGVSEWKWVPSWEVKLLTASNISIVTVPNSGCGKVMFSQASVILPTVGACMAKGVCMVGEGCAWQKGTWMAGGMRGRRDDHCSG